MTRPDIRAGVAVRAGQWRAVLDQIELNTDPPRAQLRQTVAQTYATSGLFEALTFDTEDWDNWSGHSTSTNPSRYTCQVAGIYELTGKISFNGSATGRRASKWRKNGTDIAGTQIAIIATSASDVQHPAMRIEVSLAVNDYVELFAFQESGGSLATNVSSTAQHPVMTVRLVARE